MKWSLPKWLVRNETDIDNNNDNPNDFRRMYGRIRTVAARKGKQKPTQLMESLEQWRRAQEYFNSVHDEAQIDIATYDVELARRRYAFLLSIEKSDRMKAHWC